MPTPKIIDAVVTVEPPELTRKEVIEREKRARKGFRKAEEGVIELRTALRELHIGKAWKARGYKTWELYHRAVFPDIHRSTIFRHVGHAAFEAETPALAGIPASHAAVLADVPKEEREEVYEKAVDMAGGEAPTAVQVKEAVAEHLGVEIDQEDVEEEESEVVNADTATSNPGPGAPTGGSSKEETTTTQTGKPMSKREIESREAAIDRLAKLLSKDAIKAIKTGVREISTKELVFWAGLNDQQASDIKDLVLYKLKTPSEAYAWFYKLVGSEDRFSEFQNRANAKRDEGYFYATIDGCLAVFVTRKDLKLRLEDWADKNLKPAKL